MFKENFNQMTPNHEDIKFFHDQKNNDFDTETGINYFDGGKDEGNLKYNETEQRIKKIGRSENLSQQITNAIFELDQIQLEDCFRDNEKEIQLLESKKTTAKKLILDVLNQIPRYIETVNESKRVSNENIDENYDSRNSSQKIADASLRRRISHNNLIEKIQIAKRYIENNFGQIEDEKITEWKKTEEKSGRSFPHIVRRKFSKNVFCPDNLKIEKDPNNREQIADWAFQVYDSLSDLHFQI